MISIILTNIYIYIGTYTENTESCSTGKGVYVFSDRITLY